MNDLQEKFEKIKAEAVQAYGSQTDDIETMLLLKISNLERLTKERLLTSNFACSRARSLELKADKETSLRLKTLEKLLVVTNVAVEMADIIESVQQYAQPTDPDAENLLTMREHEVFDFDIRNARNLLRGFI